MINTSNKYFLQIEPDKDGPATAPINDELTDKVIYIYERTVMPHGGMRYKGFHLIERYDPEANYWNNRGDEYGNG